MREGGREGAIGWGRLASEPEPTLDQEELLPSAIDPTVSTSSRTSSYPRYPAPRSHSTPTPHDSLLSTAVAVTFSPSAQPTLEDDEGNQDFMLEHDTLPRKVKAKSKDKEREGKKARLGDGNQGERREAQITKKDVRLKAKVKGKAKGIPPPRPVDLSEMLSEADWQRSSPGTPFKHKFEVSLPTTLQLPKYAISEGSFFFGSTF